MSKTRPAFWGAWWTDIDGRRIRRIRREEYSELWRLWIVHKDIRTGRVKA